MGDHEFDTDTTVRPQGGGSYTAELTARWGVPGGPPNGGYVMAIAARAMAHAVDRPHPASLTCHFVAQASPGPSVIEVETFRSGGRHASAEARFVQGGTEVARLLGTFADLDRAYGPTILRGGPPELPPIDECKTSPDDPDTILGRFDYRMPAEDLAWRKGEPKGEGRFRSYLSFHDDRPIDPIALVAITDAFAPAVFDLGLPYSWVPTIELTAHVRRVPDPGPVRCLISTRFVTDGYLEEDTEIWDAGGNLVAQSRQLALAPRA